MKTNRFHIRFVSLIAALGASGAFMLVSGPALRASAAPSAPDEVLLKDGSSVRGTLIEVDSGDKVVILKKGSDKTTTIAWKDVSDIEKGKFAPAKKAEPGSAGKGYDDSSSKGSDDSADSDGSDDTASSDDTANPDKPAAPDTKKLGVVKLHIQSPVPVTLMQTKPLGYVSAGGYSMGVAATRSVCTAPCDRVIDSSDGSNYFLTGPSFAPHSLELSQRRGDVTAKVDTGSPAGRTIGSLAITGGVLGALVGGPLAMVGALEKGNSMSAKDTQKGASLENTGFIILGVSGVAIVGGIIARIVSAEHVKVEASHGAKRTAAIKPRYWLGEF